MPLFTRCLEEVFSKTQRYRGYTRGPGSYSLGLRYFLQSLVLFDILIDAKKHKGKETCPNDVLARHYG